mmetsp:Transcript_4663/g.7988  ORF Transcript_4663/g.7988 Transcript_4663/m.7988 type:complete len:201 (-) Transcript_4663:209-811(-)
MGMNDTETVALIGGGHAFGKSHGACPDGPGPGPEENATNPWPGLCPEGVYTSGIEGQWTATPLAWSNLYFTYLVDNTYNLTQGDGLKYQWENDVNGLMMLTTDVALIYDADYEQIVIDFATDIEVLNNAFSAAWAKLVTNGGVWASNKECVAADEISAGLAMTTTEFMSTAEGTKEESVAPRAVVGSALLLALLVSCFVQ